MSINRYEEIELSNNHTDDSILVSKTDKSTFYERKHYSKPIRVLTVLAYILSVSLAAIILSAYYIFIWEGKPSLAYHNYLGTNIYDDSKRELDNRQINATKYWARNKFDNISSASLVIDTKSKRTLEEEYSRATTPSPNDEETTYHTSENDSSNEVLQVMEPTINVEETQYLTTPIEENSTWLPEIVNDFEGDYNEFKTEPIFIKKLFGYHKVKVK